MKDKNNMKYTLILLLSVFTSKIYCQQNEILWTVAWSPDDAYIAVGGNQGDLKLFDGKTLKLLTSYPVEDVILSRLKWHPYQNKLAVITQSETFKARILDLDTDQWIDLNDLQNSFRGLDWNYTGEYLAVSEFEGSVSIFDIQGQLVSRFMADPKGVAGIDWHPTKNILTTVGSQIGIYNDNGDTLHTFQPREVEAFLLCVEWHQSGEFFAVGDYGDSKRGEKQINSILD